VDLVHLPDERGVGSDISTHCCVCVRVCMCACVVHMCVYPYHATYIGGTMRHLRQ